MSDFKIDLGVEVNVGDIQSQIKKAKVDPIKVNLDLNNSDKEIRAIKKELSGMKFSNSSINKITKDLKNMNLAVSEVTTNFKKNGNFEVSVKGIDKLNRSISLVREYTKKGDLLNGKRISQSFETEFEKINKVFNLLKQKQKEINSLEFKLAGLNSKENVAEIKNLKAQIRSLKKEYDKLYSGHSNKFTKAQTGELTRGFKDAENKINHLKSQMADARSQLAKEIQLKINTGDFNKDISNIETKIKNLGNVSKELKNNIAQLKSNSTRMGKAFESGDIETAIKHYERYLQLLKKVNNQIGISNNTQKTINVDFSKLKELANQIDIINKKIATLDPNVNVGQISELSKQLKDAEIEYNRLHKKLQGKLNGSQLSNLSESAKKAKRELAELAAKIEDTKAKLASSINNKLINSDLGLSQIDNEIDSVITRFQALRKQPDELKIAIDGLSASFNKMKIASKNGNMDELIRANKEYEKSLKQVKIQLSINERAEKKYASALSLEDSRKSFISGIDAWLTKNSAAAKKFGSQMQQLKVRAKSCDKVTLKHLQSEFKRLDKEAEAAGLKMQTFGDRLKAQFQRYGQYFSVASAMMYAFQGLRSMFEQVKLIDTAMTELKKVTDETDASYNQFLSNAASRAKELGTTIDGIVSSTADFARLGYGFEDAQGLAEVANIYAVVGDEVDGVEGATESLISTMAAFKDETSDISNTDFAMDIVDKFNEIGNNFAISSGGIGEAMERSASSMKAANNTIDETIALITAANTVVQDPDAVGTAFKTISMRIRGATTELEEAGLETEGMVQSTAKLRQEIMALSGVDIMEADGQTFKSTYAILDELALKWKDLSDIQQATITELIAGKRQGNIVSSLMNNFDTARSALETSLKSSGSAMKEHEKWQQSLEARINSLKASWQSLSQTFMDSDFLKGTINVLSKIIDSIDFIIDRFGVLGTAIGGFTLYNVFKNGFAIDASGNKIGAYFNIFKGLGGNLGAIGLALKNNIKAADTFKSKLGAIGTAGRMAGGEIVGSFKKSKHALKNMVKDIGKALAFAAIIKAFQDISSWIQESGKEAETAAEKFDRISEELSGVDSELSGLESELSSVENQIDALLAKDELTFADEEELSRLRQVSSELEHQIKLTETLQKSLQKSLNSAAISAYNDYAKNTSFYSNESAAERKEKGKATGSAIGNIVGLLAGAIIGYYTGGASYVLAGAGIGSALGSAGGSFVGGNISSTSYYDETMVREVLDNMEYERIQLEKARDEAYAAYSSDPTGKNKEAWEEAAAALSDYNAALSKHMTNLSEYYNSIDYASLQTEKQRQDYIKMGDDLDKYNIAMGVVGAKSTALDRIFSDELITKEAKDLRAAIEATLNSGEEINFADFDSEQFTEIKNRLADVGLTIVDVVGYFEDLKKAQEEASNNYETYEVVSNIAALSDGVTALTDAFAEFNEQGIVTAKTLTELYEVFGGLGEDWVNYVDIMTNGIATVDDAREATEQLVEAYTDNLFKNGGIKFAKYNKGANDGKGGYEFDEDGYKTYLSTINELNNLGLENANEYVNALQQQAMIREAATKAASESAQRNVLLAKETLTEDETEWLNTLNTKWQKIDSGNFEDYISEIESAYGIRLKDSSLVQKQYNLNEYQSKLKDYKEYLNDIDSLSKEYQSSLKLSRQYIDDQHRLQEQWEPYIEDGYGTSGASWREAGSAFGETIETVFGSWIGFDIDTEYDKFEKIDKDYQAAIDLANNEDDKRLNFLRELVGIAEEANIDLSDIAKETGVDLNNFETTEIENWHLYDEDGLFNQVYEKVKTELNASIDKYEEDIKGLESEIETRLNNLGLEIDFGRNFDKIIIDGLKGKIEKFNTAQSEMFSTGGLSTDSIIAMDEIFGDLAGYNSSELFENTANGVRLNTEAYKKYSDQFKKVNIGAIEDKMSDLGETYEKTRDELNKLTYGTIEYQQKAQELEGIGRQIEANEELLSQYKALFSSYQEWQRAEAAGSERNMYETVLGGFETVGDEISRGWIDEGTKEFLELLKGEKATIIDGNGNKKEINIATASVQELKKVWKDLDKNIEHTTHSVRDFFTVDEEGNSTSQGVYNFLDAIGQMEEEKFGSKDVVKRNDKGNIIGFDFQMVGGDKAIAEAVGVSEELVQIMKRAAIDAGFVVTFDGSFEQLDVLREKAEAAAKEMNEILKADGKATIDIDMNVDSVEEIQPQIDKIMETFGKKDANGKLTGEINMGIKGADKALGIVRTLQSMLDEVTRPAYMDIEIGQVEEELRTPLTQLQQLRTLTEQEHQLKLSGGDTSDLEKSKQEIYDYFETLDPEIKAKIGLVDDKGNGITEESFNNLTGEQKIKLGYVDEDGKPIEDFSEAIEKKLNDGSLSIEATVDLQIEMADSLDILAQTALFEQGKISKEEYDKRISVYLDAEVDDSDAKDKIDTSILKITGDETKEEVITIIAEAFGIEDVEDLKSATSSLTDKQVRAIAEAIGNKDVEALDSAIEGMDGNVVQAIANALGYSDVESLKAAVKNMQGNEVDAKVNTDGQKEKIDTLQSWIDGLKGKSVIINIMRNIVETVSSGGKKKAAQRTGADPAGNDSEVNGTAHVNGTIGRAFKQGDWRTKKSETALTGELGREIVVTPQNRWYTVGDNGAEFVNIPRGSIVFNHRQTEELLRNGKATSDGGRAKALVNGTAFIGGTAHRGDAIDGMLLPENPSFKIGYDYSASSSDSDSKKSQEIFDWIEIAIERIEREIDNLDRTANNVYKSWSSRNKALANEIGKVSNEIALQESAYQGYINAANQVGLSSEWKNKVQIGAIDIDNVTDETLAEKIKDYQKYYEQALDCKDAIEELKETESSLFAQRFENIQTQYDGILQGYEHTEAMLNEYISQAEEQGYIVSKKYYNALIANEKSNIKELKKEQADLIAERDNAVAEGKIVKGSEAWYEQCAAIDEVTQAIEEANTALIEYSNSVRDIDWQIFDLIQERISDITAESEFLIELMSNKDLFDDNGKFTEQGVATVGLHALNYNTSMYQADDYGKEVAKLDEQIAKDPYDQELINRRRELIDLQRESILAAEDEKNAIKDLVEEGINLELDALQERIDLHNEELDSMKDLYDYQKNVEKQTENIASLRKQLGAYESFDDEETRAKVQELKVSLEEAETDLQETEYDKFISDQTALLDTLYTEYETILNSRLDNIDFLLQQVIDGINMAAGAEGTITSALGADGAISAALGSGASTIGETLKTEVGAVGTKLSTAMSNIWLGDGSGRAVLDLYGKDFQNRSTTANEALNKIKTDVNAMVDDIDKDAKKKVEANNTTTSAQKNPTTATNTNKSTTTTNQTSSNNSKITDDTLMGIASAIWVYGSSSGWGDNPFRENKLKNKIGEANAKKVQDYINSYGSSGKLYNFWIQKGKNLDKYKYSAFKSGVKDVDTSQLAWTQEGRKQEFIIRPSDGAILTPVAKGDSVLNAAASNNIWDMANSPAEFIKDNLSFGTTNVPNNSTVQSNYIQNFENVIFSMPNVHGYNELLSEMQRDPKFEKLILSMTIDQIAGKSSLTKGKSIR